MMGTRAKNNCEEMRRKPMKEKKGSNLGIRGLEREEYTPVGTFEAKFDRASMTRARTAIPEA